MNTFIAALPMYDWPEARAGTDADWGAMRAAMTAAGIDAPAALVRRNADMPAVPGGIRDAQGRVVAPDPATLPPDDLDLATLWRHPGLLVAQTCWGPMETTGLEDMVQVVGQPDYSAFDGGDGPLYCSAILVRGEGGSVAPPRDGRAMLPLDRIAGSKLAFNETHSMSGLLALARDLEAAGSDIGIVSARLPTGGHRASIRAVAGGMADICTVDCRSWDMARRFEPAAAELRVVGWTSRRPGLPYIAGRNVGDATLAVLREVLSRPTAARPADRTTTARYRSR